MKKTFFLLLYIALTVTSSFAADRDELFTRPPVRGRFYKILGTDNVYSWKDVIANEVVSASGILGKVHIGLPNIASATHNPVYVPGIRILAASDVADPTPSLRWYTFWLINDASRWVIDMAPWTAAQRTTQWYTGDGGTDTITLDHVAHKDGFIVESVTDPPISHVNEWVLNSNYTQNLDANGYVESIDLVSGYRWYPHMRFRIRYVRADE